jgi:mRNA interferase MazF
VYWVELDEPFGSEPGYNHPYVVIQNNVFNQSRIKTVVMCALTSNLKRAQDPGNVALDLGEAGLTKPSVVQISQILTVDKSEIGDYIGALSRSRVRQILDGVRLLTEPREAE